MANIPPYPPLDQELENVTVVPVNVKSVPLKKTTPPFPPEDGLLNVAPVACILAMQEVCRMAKTPPFPDRDLTAVKVVGPFKFTYNSLLEVP